MKNSLKTCAFILSICALLTANASYKYSNEVANRSNIESKAKLTKKATNKNTNELVIYNCADYIDNELIEEFEKEYNCVVKYYEYDTNETMYNKLILQPEGTYDLICTSEYMLQKMVRAGLVEPLNVKDECPVYAQYASKEVSKKLDTMSIDDSSTLADYVAGYMWGTLGIIYDSEYGDTIKEDVKSWDIFWNSKYKNVISIKNSMRDTFVVGLMHAYQNIEKKENLTDDESEFVASVNRAKESANSEQEVIQNIFDMVINEEKYNSIVEVVKEELISLKQNIFGFEVDSGKNDIITGKIKMNLAWSGDAVFSISTALDETDKVLEYYVPDDGSNVWYDGWCLPNGSNRDLATKFIDFLSIPENASRNMEYIGYTPFVACDEVFDYASRTYGLSEYNEDTTYYGPYHEEEEDYDVDGNYVVYNGKYYQAFVTDDEFSNILPTDTTHWVEVNAEGLSLSDPYNLNFFFKNDESTRDYTIYPFEEMQNSLETQYPSSEVLDRCAVMKDFEARNDDVIIMWGQLRAYTSMTVYYVILATVAFAAITFGVVTFIQKRKSIRNRRKSLKN